ncbi:MAG: hypothetical protein DI536_15335 [Archangium gephyra]|uniref:Uncharacterized protein n=1 Tax=Archangium gephyra TaxID=48 RepID=A0A2W5THZ5_9BACT|nr:MAG: hypothetical protein DI536_15335 [Archangium gephyra]
MVAEGSVGVGAECQLSSLGNPTRPHVQVERCLCAVMALIVSFQPTRLLTASPCKSSCAFEP